MPHNDGTRLPACRFWQVLLLLVALDTLACGLWAVLRPRDLIAFLGVPPRNDAYAWQLLRPSGPSEKATRTPIPPPRDAGLWHLLGLLTLGNAGLLAIAAVKPAWYGSLVVVPLLGRGLGAALWLWALGTTYTFAPARVPFPERLPLVYLAVHEAAGLVLLAAFLVFWRVACARRDGTEPARTVE
jgi:hypothetical protein